VSVGHPPPASERVPRTGQATLDDPTLIARARDGDLRALETLLRRHQVAMYRLALRILGDRSDAEDAVQEAFVSAWRRLDTYREDAAFTSWLYRIVTNRCLNMARTGHHRLSVPTDHTEAVVAASAGTSPEAAAEVSGATDALGAALATLPAEQRACWVLRENDGLGYQEIAEIVGLSPVAVRGQIHRARTNLARRLRDWR
jgi:RNA polymerase sigma-70 factor (ECF subfamily)